MNNDINMTDTLSPPTEREKWEKEQAFKEMEFTLKEREFLLKDVELDLKKKEYAAAGWKSPLVVAIIAASIAAFGNAIVAMTNGLLQRELEDQKSEQARILEMIKTGDPDKAAENLKFLLKAGLISKPETSKKLSEYLAKREPGSGTALPSATGFSGNTLKERIDALKKQSIVRSVQQSEHFQIDNHILLDNFGNPVSVVEAPAKGRSLKKLKAIVLHFSATDTGEGTITWLKSTKAQTSTHLVIDREGKVTQMVPFDIAAWHAGPSTWNGLSGLNYYSLGIHFINAGQLTLENNKWISSTGVEYLDEEVFLSKNSSGEVSGWHKYTDHQVQTANRIIHTLISTYPTIEAVLGHSDIAPERKVDPGPAFPIEQMQEIVKQLHVNLTNQSSELISTEHKTDPNTDVHSGMPEKLIEDSNIPNRSTKNLPAATVRKIISEQLDIPLEKIVDNANIKTDLGADDLDFIDLIMALDEKSGRNIYDEEAMKLKSIKDIIQFMSTVPSSD